MNKLRILLPVMIFALILLSGCGLLSDTDTWDGSVAATFPSGDGSETSPYVIKTGAQLAYLAECVNKGTNFAGKHFELARDIDLAGLPWTPIGNTAETAFSGRFDGNGHTISGLSVKPSGYDQTYEEDFVVHYCIGGLFGIVENAVLEDFRLQDPVLSLLDAEESAHLMLGLVCGYAKSRQEIRFRDIDVSGGRIVLDYGDTLKDTGTRYMHVGGLAGRMFGDEGAACSVERVQIDLSMTLGANHAFGLENHFGALIGNVSVESDADLTDAACYMDVHFSEARPMELRLAALGCVAIADGNFTVRRTFSRITTNAQADEMYRFDYSIAAIMAQTSYNSTSRFVLEDAYGSGTWLHRETGEAETVMKLYMIYDPAYATEQNCAACETLPEGHGLVSDVWDVSDPKKPVLKH